MQPYNQSKIDQLANEHQLGAPRAIYRRVPPRSEKRRQYIGAICAAIFIMFFPSFMLIGSLLDPSTKPEIIPFSIAFFLFFCILTLLLLANIIRRITVVWHVFLYAKGFISVKRHKITTVRWEQITAIRHILRSDLLFLADGTKLIFNTTFLNIETAHLLDTCDKVSPWFTFIGRQEAETTPLDDKLEKARYQEREGLETELIHTIEREVFTRLFPKISDTYHEGTPVAFSRLQISTQGICNGKATLPWADIEQITLCGDEGDPLPDDMPSADSHTFLERLDWWQREVFSQDTILISKRDRQSIFWLEKIIEIPNAFLLMELVNQVLRQSSSDQR